MNRAGELAALGTALAFAVSSVFHTLAGRRVGSVIVNRARLLLAVTYLLILHLLAGIPLPSGAGPERIFWLGISGAIGLALGDALLFQAFVIIGARMGMLLLALAPVLATLMGWFFFNEILGMAEFIGILLAIGGVAVVVLERGGGAASLNIPRRVYVQGVLLGIGAAACQAGGLITARPGMAGDFPALSGTLIRMSVAALIIWGIALFQRQIGQTFRKMDRKTWQYLAIGALVGPTLGVTLSLFAVQNTAVGIASTLMALTPVFLLPIGYYFFKEKIGWSAIAGTLLAVAGVALLFLF